MARMKNNFKVTREQIEMIIEALGNAECWKMELCERFPQYESIYSQRIQQFISLEFELKGYDRETDLITARGKPFPLHNINHNMKER